METSVALIIPVYNGGGVFADCLAAIAAQTVPFCTKIVIDSSSTDGSADLARAAGFDVVTIAKAAFDHGGTRNLALNMVSEDFVVFLTQDAILARSDAVAQLLQAFGDSSVAGAYGRQLPHLDADPLATFTRARNYGAAGYVTARGDALPQGLGKCFLSNSFSAYRRADLVAIGGFPEKLIMGEDSFAAAKFLMAGKKVAYQAEAVARHSHNYTVMQEFARYFDIGVFHDDQIWMLNEFGGVQGQGVRFALDQLRALYAARQYRLLPVSFAASAAKFIGYRLGRRCKTLGRRLSARLAMHKGYFAVR